MTVTRIVQLTDLHVFADPAATLAGIPTRETLADVLAHVAQHAGPVEHVVVTGDHTHDELPETYAALRAMLEPWRGRLWQVPGNHDDRSRLRAAFAPGIPGSGAEPVRFALPAGGWLCLGLDTQSPGEVAGVFEPEQADWVRGHLAEHDAQGVVLFLHHPPVLLGSAWLDPIGLRGRELLVELIEADPRIRLVCCGHVHHASEHRVGAARVVTTPSTGLQFDPRGATTTLAADPPGYRVIDLDGGRCSTHVVRLPEVRFTPSFPL